MAIKGGYLGLCEINGLKIRVTSFTVNVQQEVQFYDHIEFSTGRLVYDWMRAIYDPKTGAMGYKKFFQIAEDIYNLLKGTKEV